MGSLGSLNVDLSAEIAQFIGAMDRAAYKSEQAGKQIQKSIAETDAQMKRFVIGTVAALASFQTVDYFAGLVKGSISAAAALDDMAERTGNTVEQLSGLVQVAKIGGHDVSVMELAMTKLAKGMTSADKEAVGAGAALAFLNVKAKDANGNLRPTGDLMVELAGKLEKYADGSGKAAIAQALFGKSGAAVLPFMKDLAEQGALVVTTTAAQAAEAERYEKSLKRLAAQKEELVRVVSFELLPVMQAVLEVYARSKTGADSTGEAIKRLSADGSVRDWAQSIAIGGAFVVDAFNGVKTVALAVGQAIAGTAAIGIAFADGAASGALTGNMAAAYQMGAQIAAAQKDTVTQIDLTLRGYKSVRGELQAVFDKQKEVNDLVAKYAGGQFKDANDARAAAPRAALNFALPDTTAIKKVKDDAEALQTLLDKIFNKESGLDSGFTKDLRLLEAQLRNGNIKSTEDYIRVVEALIQQQPFYVKARDAAIKVDVEAADLMEKLKKRFDDAVTSTKQMVEGMEFELAAMQLTNTEREIAIKLREMELKGVVKGSEAYTEYADRIRAAVEAKDGLQGQIDLFKSIEQVAHQTWQSVTAGGKGAAERIRDAFKNGVYELLYQLTLKPFYINVVASLTGNSSSGSAVANALGGGSGSGLGSLLNLGGSAAGIYGSTAAYGAALGTTSIAAGSQAAMLASQTAAFGAEGLAATASAAGGAAGGATSMLATLGPYAAAALAAYALYSAFAQKRGGPKEGGSFVGTYGAGGGLQTSALGTLFGVGTDNANVSNVAQGYSKSYFDIVKQLGGTASAVQFGLGYDSDPRGTAQNRIDSNLSINGKQVYNVKDREFGRDNAQIGPQLQLEASRMLLIALQNSSLPPALTKVFNAVNAASATQAEIDAVMKSAQAMKSLFDTLDKNPVADAARQIEDSQNAMAAAVRRNHDALQSLIDQYDGSAAAAENLAGATSQYYLAQVNLLVQFEEITKSVNEMFGQTFRQIELAGMDKQAQYDFYQNEADALMQALLGSSDVNEIQRLAEKINADINSAFGLLDASQQQSQSGDFLDRGRAAQQLINDQIRAVQKEVSDRTTADMNTVRDLLTAAAGLQQDAADTFAGAVSNFAGSISNGININVTSSTVQGYGP